MTIRYGPSAEAPLRVGVEGLDGRKMIFHLFDNEIHIFSATAKYRAVRVVLSPDDMQRMVVGLLPPEARQHLNVQHPMKVVWMAHCTKCGTYVEDTETQPPADYLCDTCSEEKGR